MARKHSAIKSATRLGEGASDALLPALGREVLSYTLGLVAETIHVDEPPAIALMGSPKL
ncbi:MAG: hypothetical protein ABIO51_01870 [Solirubrobacteraceae bacterium]